MAKKKSGYEQSQGEAYIGVTPPPKDNSDRGLVPITRQLVGKLIKQGKVSQEYYELSKHMGMTHYNYRTGNFSKMVEEKV